MSDFVENLIFHVTEFLAFNCFTKPRSTVHFSVYLPSSSHSDNDYMEYLGQLWSLCDLYLNKGPCCFVGDFNAALGGKQGGPRGLGVNAGGKKLIEFWIILILLLSTCSNSPRVHFTLICQMTKGINL